MPKKYKAIVDLSLRKAPDPAAPLYGDWHEWPAGTVFEPPKHMDVKRALERGIVEEVVNG